MLDLAAMTFNDAEDRTLDLASLRQFAEANSEDKLAGGKSADFLAETILGVDASEVSALFVVDLIRGATGLENMISSVYGGAMYLRIRQGQWSLLGNLCLSRSHDANSTTT